MPDQVRPDLKRDRSRDLTRLSVQKRSAFAEQNVGETVAVVVEQPLEEDGYVVGVSDNYLRVRFEASPGLCGETVPVRITGADAHSVTGRLA